MRRDKLSICQSSCHDPDQANSCCCRRPGLRRYSRNRRMQRIATLNQFELRNFVFMNGQESYWYGGYDTDSAITLSDQYVYPSSSPITQKFTFKTQPGASASFTGFSQFRLFAKYTGQVIATADLPQVQGGKLITTPTSEAETPKPSSADQSMSLLRILGVLGLSLILVLIF